MSGLGLERLRRPQPQYNPTHRKDFASSRTHRRWDQEAARQLFGAADLPDAIADPGQVRSLASKLDYQRPGGSRRHHHEPLT